MERYVLVTSRSCSAVGLGTAWSAAVVDMASFWFGSEDELREADWHTLFFYTASQPEINTALLLDNFIFLSATLFFLPSTSNPLIHRRATPPCWCTA